MYALRVKAIVLISTIIHAKDIKKVKMDKENHDEQTETTEEILPMYEMDDSFVKKETKAYLIYGVTDTPPIHVTVISGLQVGFDFLSFSFCLICTLISPYYTVY